MRGTRGFVVALAAGALMLAGAPAGAATFENFSFEAQLNGWSFDDAGTGNHLVCQGGTTCSPAAIHGRFYVRLEAGDPGVPVAGWQHVNLEAGEVISGSALFQTNESLFNDSASVKVFAGPTLVAAPWSASVVSPGPAGWRGWSFTAPADGTYTIRYEVTNAVDRFVDSLAHFDSVETSLSTRGAIMDGLDPMVRFEARLTRSDNGVPLDGETVEFSVGGTPVCSATTTTNGTASCGAVNATALATAIVTGYTAEFNGSANGLPTEEAGTVLAL